MPVGISRPPPWSTTNAFPTEKGGYVANQLPARKEWGLKVRLGARELIQKSFHTSYPRDTFEHSCLASAPLYF